MSDTPELQIPVIRFLNPGMSAPGSKIQDGRECRSVVHSAWVFTASYLFAGRGSGAGGPEWERFIQF